MSNVPKLRFKEFSGEWESGLLKDISTFYNGKAYKQVELLSSGKYPVLRVGNFFTNNSWYYSDLELDENKYCDNGDLLYAWSASFGPRIWEGDKVIYHYHIWKVVNHQQITKKFLYIILDNETARMKAQSANGFALLHITKGTIENWKVNIPSKQEQEKIASFLTSVDRKIQLLTKKEELLSSYKKGVMQKIFSGEIRFKADDGSEFAQWEEKKIKDLFIYKNGGSFEKNIVEDGLYNLITLNSINISGELKSEHKRVNVNDGSLMKDDLIMVLSDVAHGNFLGLTAIIPEDNSYVLNQRMGALKSKTSDNISFIRMYINYNQKYFKLHGQGSSQQNLSKGDIEKFVVNLPCLEEQTKIANFLSSIDNKIEQVGKQLDESKQFKKALLQQMFV